MAIELKELLLSQHHAGLKTLAKCIELCPESAWQEKVANLPISTAVFHTLFWTDMYLELNTDNFQEQEYHLQNAAMFGDYEELKFELQQQTYQLSDIESYLQFCRTKAERVILAETDDSLAAKSGFYWLDCSRAEVHVYSTRHIEHHAAQIALRLRINHSVEVPWVKRGWREPESAQA